MKPQKTIDAIVKDGGMVVQCCVYGTVKDPESGVFVGYRFDKPYNNISHTYCPEAYEEQMEMLRRGYL